MNEGMISRVKSKLFNGQKLQHINTHLVNETNIYLSDISW